MGFEGPSQFHEALVCPICPKLFVESLWSLIAHINAVHRDNPLVLDYHSLQRLKKIVPKSSVCVIRPAFTADGKQSEFLNFFSDGIIRNSNASESKDSETPSLQRTPSFPEASEKASESKSVSPEPLSLDLSISRKSTSPLEAPPPPQTLKSPSIPIDSPKTLLIASSSTSTTSSTATVPGGNRRVKRHSPYPRATKKQVCQKCGELFDNRCLLTLHMMVHKRQTHPYQCPINGCFQCYDSKMKFRSHLNRVHRELTPVNMEKIIKVAAQGDTINEMGFEMPTFVEENNNNSNDAITSTEKLTETIEKAIKKEIFDS
uniref:C2H2-type domain-containing protein n=1 Tax=Panagrolaimus sp. ES5 TaxID=591445 RepID=A0AC34FL62_9BILA